jgi:MiaB/RimO family radical SAM methylthiotransferase
MRIRFTSPHPKDFPDDLLHVIRDEPNVCRQIHLPAQSGSSRVLEAMRRGYTSDAYLQLVEHIRHVIPDVSLSSDFIAGFCGETEEDHKQTLDLMRIVKYNFAFCFPYSMRQKTRASHTLTDNVCEQVKRRRHDELINAFRQYAQELNCAQIGRKQLVLIEGDSKKSEHNVVGRNEANTQVIVPKAAIPVSADDTLNVRVMQPGDYIMVQITEASSQVLKATALYHTTLMNSSVELY